MPADPDAHADPAAEPVMLSNLTSPATGELLQTLEMVLLPVGAHEQHGPALPVSTDALVAQVLSTLAASLLGPRVAVAPVVPWGVSWQHTGRPGTMTLREETLIALVMDVGESLFRQGVRRILIVNTHGGNTPALTIAAERLKREVGVPVVAPVYAYSLLANAARGVLGPDAIGHAGGDEASAVLALRPDLVDRGRLETPRMDADLQRVKTILAAAGGSLPVRFDRLTSSGATGDAAGASAETGTGILAEAAGQLRAICEEVLDLNLDRV
jgi:creatinine amidohydrolase